MTLATEPTGDGGGRLDRRLRAALVVLTLAKGFVFIGIAPVWKVADEPAHFDDIQYRAERLSAPRPTGAPVDAVMGKGVSAEMLRSWEVTQHYWRTRYLANTRQVPEEAELRQLAQSRAARLTDGQMPAMSYPSLYYDLGTLPYFALRHASIVARVFAVRVLSLGFGLLAVLCTFAAARLVLADPWMAFAAAVCVALQPVASQQTAAVNNDAAVIGVGALLFYLQMRVLAAWPAPPSARLCAALGAVAGLALMTKPQAVALLPGCAVVLAVAFYRARRERQTWVRLGAALAAFVLLAVPAALELRASLRAFAVLNRAQRGAAPALHHGFVGWVAHLDPRLRDHLFSSYWGRFAWMECRMHPSWFDWLHQGIALGAIGLLLAIGARLAGLAERWWSWRGLAFSAGTAITASGFLLYTEYHARADLGVAFVTQGRNYFFVLPAVAIVAAIAFCALCPARLRTAVAATLVSCAVMLNLGALATIARYHYGN